MHTTLLKLRVLVLKIQGVVNFLGHSAKRELTDICFKLRVATGSIKVIGSGAKFLSGFPFGKV